MSFTNSVGTRGARQPGRVVRIVNTVIARVVRRRGALGGNRALLLTTVGRKSGQERTVPLQWFPDEDGAGESWLIVAAAAGAARNPAWFHNLAAAPERARIELGGGEKVDVSAEQLHGAERESAFARIAASSSQFEGYKTKTDRELPVIRLRRRPGTP